MSDFSRLPENPFQALEQEMERFSIASLHDLYFDLEKISKQARGAAEYIVDLEEGTSLFAIAHAIDAARLKAMRVALRRLPADSDEADLLISMLGDWKGRMAGIERQWQKAMPLQEPAQTAEEGGAA